MKSKGTIAVLLLSIAAGMAAPAARAGFFTSYFDDFKKWVESGASLKAIDLYSKERSYFEKLSGAEKQFVEAFFADRDEDFRSRLDTARAELALASAQENVVERWITIRKELAEAPEAEKSISPQPVLGPLADQALRQLSRTVDRMQREFEQEAASNLSAYGLLSDPPFASVYPVDVAYGPILAANPEYQSLIARGTADQLAMLKTEYLSKLEATDPLHAQVAQAYINRLIRDRNARSYAEKSAIYGEAAAKGFETATRQVDSAILVIRPDAANGGYSTSPPQYVAHIRLREDQTPADFMTSASNQADIMKSDVIVFSRIRPVVAAQVDSDEEQILSDFIVGKKTVDNPAYKKARDELRAAEKRLSEYEQRTADTSSSSSGDSNLALLAGVLQAAAGISIQSDVDSANRKLASTPKTIEEAVTQNYRYKKKKVTVSKLTTIDFAIYDRGTGRFTHESEPVMTRAAYPTVTAVSRNDPQYSAIVKKFYTTAEVAAERNKPVKLSYDDIWKMALKKIEAGAP